MKRTLLLASCLSFAPSVFGAYSYYYTDSFSSLGSNWTTNGSVSGGSSGLTTGGSSGGSVVSTISVPHTAPATAGNYEVKMTLNLASSGGTYAIYLDASSNAMSGPSPTGTFYSVEVTPTISGGVCTAAVVVNKSISGSITTLSYNTFACSSSMVVRAVRLPGSPIYYYIDNIVIMQWDTSISSGQPGVGAWNMPSGNSISNVSLGKLDVVNPYAVSASGIGTSAFPNRVDVQWQPTTDNLPNGVGLAFYAIVRNGSWISNVPVAYGDYFSDATVSPSTTYTYTIYAYDYHGNNVGTTFTVTTPPSGSVDPRQVGVRPTGAYWGASPEQVNLLSGNLSYSLPLLKAQGRTAGVGFSLSYNSQNWRQDTGGVWNLGQDVGYGYGWKLLAGSITPYWTYLSVDHYTFTDATGAQYRLNINTGNVWTSTDSVYIAYDANAGVLHFPDGTFWNMGCESAGTEQDAGTLYPTTMEDTNGNQILITYEPGVKTSWSNSSARIQNITDVRADSGPTYSFTYNSDPIPHLTSITNTIATGEAYTFSYSGFTLTDPFTSTSFGTSTALCGGPLG